MVLPPKMFRYMQECETEPHTLMSKHQRSVAGTKNLPLPPGLEDFVSASTASRQVTPESAISTTEGASLSEFSDVSTFTSRCPRSVILDTARPPPWSNTFQYHEDPDSSLRKGDTAVVIHGVPRRFTQDAWLNILKNSGYYAHRDIDGLYFPTDKRSGLSLGYCMMKFVNVSTARAFMASFHERHMGASLPTLHVRPFLDLRQQGKTTAHSVSHQLPNDDTRKCTRKLSNDMKLEEEEEAVWIGEPGALMRQVSEMSAKSEKSFVSDISSLPFSRQTTEQWWPTWRGNGDATIPDLQAGTTEPLSHLGYSSVAAIIGMPTKMPCFQKSKSPDIDIPLKVPIDGLSCAEALTLQSPQEQTPLQKKKKELTFQL